jgi:threonine dehydrogenase-like Zn-dependent dehydrogenase
MRGVWLEQGRVLVREDLPRPELGPGEALVRVRLASICATDLELLRGYMDFVGIPGHEFVGEVLECPSAPEWVGARVVGEINAACGACATCLAGRPRHCPTRTVLGILGRGGAFAELLALPVGNLHRVPASVVDAAAVSAEPLAAALEVAEQVQLRPEQRVVLIGAGRLGQLLARCIAPVGCALQVVTRHARHRTPLSRLGIECTDEAGVSERAYDLVVEASGSPTGLALALRCVRPAGALVLKSTFAGPAAIDAAALVSALVVDEITVVGSRCGPMAPALRLLQAGSVDPTDLIEGLLPLEQAAAAFQAAAQPGALKWLLQP